VKGSLIDESTMPVAGVPVVASSNSDVVAAVVSADDGSYTLPLAANRNYNIGIEQAAATTMGYLGQQLAVNTGTADQNGQVLQLHSIDSWVVGTVTDSSGAPLALLPVQVRSGDSLYVSNINTAEDGSYQLGIFSGNWFVRAITEAQGFAAAEEVELAAQSGQTMQVDFVATTSGFSAECLSCHASINESSDCSTCHGDQWSQPVPNIHHDSAVTATWGFGCLSCHTIGFDPATGSYRLGLPSPVQCEACHVSLYPEKPTTEIIHHNLSN